MKSNKKKRSASDAEQKTIIIKIHKAKKKAQRETQSAKKDKMQIVLYK